MYKDDRRMFERFEVDFSSAIKQSQEEENNFAKCCDVSASGVGLFTEQMLIPDTSIEIYLSVPNGHPPFQGFAKVIWSKQVQENRWRSGLELAKLDFMGIRRIFAKSMPKV